MRGHRCMNKYLNICYPLNLHIISIKKPVACTITVQYNSISVLIRIIRNLQIKNLENFSTEIN